MSDDENSLVSGGLVLKLEQLSPDFRGNDIVLRLTMTNAGAETIDIKSITPRLPDGARLIEVEQSSTQAQKSRHASLCRDLQRIAEFVVNEQLQGRNPIAKKTTPPEPTWRNLWISHTEPKLPLDVGEKLKIEVGDVNDAQSILTRFFPKEQTGADQRSFIEMIFQTKKEQLEHVERTLQADNKRVIEETSVAILESRHPRRAYSVERWSGHP